MTDDDRFKDIFDDSTGLDSSGGEVDDLVSTEEENVDLGVDLPSSSDPERLDEINTDEIDAVDVGGLGSDVDVDGLGSGTEYQEFDPMGYSISPYGAFSLGMMVGDPEVQGTIFGGSLSAKTGSGVVEAEEFRGGDAVEITYTGKFADTEFSYLDTTRHTDFGDVTVEDGEVVSQGHPLRSMDLSDLDSASEAYKMVVDDADDAREIARSFDGRTNPLSEFIGRDDDQYDSSIEGYDDFVKG